MKQQKAYLLLAILVTTQTAVGDEADDQPLLRLETGGHTAICKWLDFTPDGQTLVSVGHDKVVRLWDVSDPPSPQLQRSIRLQIGAGPEGTLYAGDLSPDGKWLAVGGFGFRGGKCHIHILNLTTGDVAAVLKGHSNVIIRLAFSGDGARLASASGDKTVRVWNVAMLKERENSDSRAVLTEDEISAEVLTGHTDLIYGLAWLPRNQRSGVSLGSSAQKTGANALRLVSGAADDTARLWERQRDGSWKTVATMTGHTNDVMEVACSPDGRWIATSSRDRSVRLWNADGAFEKVLGTKPGSFPTNPAIHFSADSRWLVAADESGNCGGAVVWTVPDGKLVSRFDGHDTTVFRARFAPLGTHSIPLVASTGGNANEILLWSAESGDEVGRIVGRGCGVFAAAFSPDGRQFAWGWTNQGRTLSATTPLTARFDLHEFVPVESSASDANSAAGEVSGPWLRGRLTSDGYSAAVDGANINTLIIRRGQRQVSRIARRQSLDRIRCYAFLPGRRQIVVGSNAELTLHDAESGKHVKKLVGHTGEIWAVAIGPDGNTLLSASGDQTLRMWDLNSDTKSETSAPLLNFFFTKDHKDFIAWTQEGYYTASPGGQDLIGWHINRGIDKTADFAAAWQYAKLLHRPEVVELIPIARSTEKAIEMAAEILKTRPSKMVDVRFDQAQLAVPEIKFTSPQSGVRLETDSVMLDGIVSPKGSLPISDIRITVNGRPVVVPEVRELMKSATGQSESPQPIPVKLKVPLFPNDENVISVVATTKFATTQPKSVTVISDISSFVKPKLYVLGVGVADYEDTDMTLSFPDDDVIGVADALKQQKGRYYEDVIVEQLLNDAVTERGLRRAVKNLQTQVTQYDMAIVMITGHGYAAPDGTYYFCPHDFDQEEPEITGIPYSVLTDPLKDLPCKVVLCMDTCHAAGVLGPAEERGLKSRGRRSALEQAINDMASVESGVVVLTSSTGREPSFESEGWGHGAFSLALIEALTGKHKFSDGSKVALPADTNRDRFLEISEIDSYITSRVRELTRGRQHPVTERGRLPSFTLAVSQ